TARDLAPVRVLERNGDRRRPRRDRGGRDREAASRRRGGARGVELSITMKRITPLLLAGVAAVFAMPAAAQDMSQGRRVFLEKADCQYCHGWAGDGAGAGQSPGG